MSRNKSQKALAADAQALAHQAAAEHEAFMDKYRADVAIFERSNPDFMEAYCFLLNSRAAELKVIGFDTPDALHNAVIADEKTVAQMAFQNGKSPAEAFYKLANQRGYKRVETAVAKARPLLVPDPENRLHSSGARHRSNVH